MAVTDAMAILLDYPLTPEDYVEVMLYKQAIIRERGVFIIRYDNRLKASNG